MSVGGVGDSSYDGNLTDRDIDPIFELYNVLAESSEELVDWYTQTVDELETASDWLTWLGAATTEGRGLGDESEADRVAFTSWMNEVGFDYTKYFDETTTSSGQLSVDGISSSYEVSEVNELMAIEVEVVSTDAEQAKALSTAVLSNFSDTATELTSLIDTLRSAARGHIRS